MTRPRTHRASRAHPLRCVLLLVIATGCTAEAPVPDTSTASDPSTPSDSSAAVYEGAWFEVTYPADFTVRPSLESSSAEGYDSVFFDSPDGEVTFYVHSPQWGGEPSDIALDPATEVLQDSTSTAEGPVTTTRLTIRAVDGSWERSYVTEADERGPSRWTIGWRYASDAARERYAPAFEAFRESLMQFGD